MAIGDIISRLSVELSLDSAAFEQGARKAGSHADALGDRMEKLGNRVGTALRSFATAAAIGGIGVLIKQGLDYASSLGETAQQLGVTSTALQEYRFAATQVGISQEEMDAGLAKLTKSMGMAANGSKVQYDAFAQLSKLMGTDILKSAKDAGDAIPMIADALAKIKDPAARARIETELFGKAGQKLDTLLSGGSAAVNQLRDAAHNLGVVLSEQQIQEADRTADKLSELKTVLSANIAGVVASNATAIYNLANSLSSLASQSLQIINDWPRLSTALAGMAVGARFGGIGGAAAGGALGFLGGERMAEANNDSNMNLQFRQQRLAAAMQQYNRTKNIPNSAYKATLEKETRLTRLAVAASKQPARPSSANEGSARDVTAPKEPNDPKGPKDRTAEIEKRFNDQLANYAQQTLSARGTMAASAEQAAEFDLRGVEISRLRTLTDIRLNKDFSDTQKARLVLEVEDLADAERGRIAYQLQRTQEDHASELAKEQVDGQRARLDAQLGLAGTEAERQTIALELFDLDQEEKRQSLERILNSAVRTKAEKALAQTALNSLNANAGAARANASRSNETQVQNYLRGLDKTPQQINEAIDGIKIDGLKSLNEGLVDAIMGAKSLGDVFKNVANQVIADLLRIAVQKAVIGPLANALFGGSGGDNWYDPLPSKGGGILGGVLKGVGKIFGFATGTPSAPPGLAWVGERGPELVDFRGGERVMPSGTSRTGRGDSSTRVEIVDTTGLFRFAVDGQIMQAAPGIADAGAGLAQKKMAYNQSRRLAA